MTPHFGLLYPEFSLSSWYKCTITKTRRPYWPLTASQGDCNETLDTFREHLFGLGGASASDHHQTPCRPKEVRFILLVLPVRPAKNSNKILSVGADLWQSVVAAADGVKTELVTAGLSGATTVAWVGYPANAQQVTTAA